MFEITGQLETKKKLNMIPYFVGCNKSTHVVWGWHENLFSCKSRNYLIGDFLDRKENKFNFKYCKIKKFNEVGNFSYFWDQI